MATLSASRRNSAANTATTSIPIGSPRLSITGNNVVPKMSSLNEEDDTTSQAKSGMENINNEINSQETERIYTSSISGKILKEICDNGERKKLYRTRSCSERSDSGISDCSNSATTASSGGSCTSTPLLCKKFSINEEPEYEKTFSAANEEIAKKDNTPGGNTNKVLDGDSVDKNKLSKINNSNNEETRIDATDNSYSVRSPCQVQGKFLMF